MKYIDSSIQSEEQTVAHWMNKISQSSIAEFRCQVGYFTLEGSSVLLPTIADCANKNARVSILLGSNGGATLASHVAYLVGRLNIPRANVSLGVVKYANSLFHPKVYVFSRSDGSKTCYVGSANMTGPGISGKNVEAGLILDTAEGDDFNILDQICQRIESWFANRFSGLNLVSGPDDIDKLLASKSLALNPVPRSRDIGEEGAPASIGVDLVAERRKSLITLPAIPREAGTEVVEPRPYPDLSEREFDSLTARTEASFHYPQGTHLGHILSILFFFAADRADTPFDDKYIRLSGGFGYGRLATYRRQIKFKLQAAIEIGLICDIRLSDNVSKYSIDLTERGIRLWGLFEPHIRPASLEYARGEDGMYSTQMPLEPRQYNEIIFEALNKSAELKANYLETMLRMPAVDQMMKLLQTFPTGALILKSSIYKDFFQSVPVEDFCNSVGIEPATEEGVKHRCPFLLNILESCGIVKQATRKVSLVNINS